MQSTPADGDPDLQSNGNAKSRAGLAAHTEPGTPTTPELTQLAEARRLHWQANVRIVLCLLVVWFSVSFGCGIVFAEFLNQWNLPGTGFPLGFWFAQQGSMLVFVALVVIYVLLASRLDRRYGEQPD